MIFKSEKKKIFYDVSKFFIFLDQMMTIDTFMFIISYLMNN